MYTTQPHFKYDVCDYVFPCLLALCYLLTWVIIKCSLTSAAWEIYEVTEFM